MAARQDARVAFLSQNRWEYATTLVWLKGFYFKGFTTQDLSVLLISGIKIGLRCEKNATLVY
jgi:hypothetical protein